MSLTYKGKFPFCTVYPDHAYTHIKYIILFSYPLYLDVSDIYLLVHWWSSIPEGDPVLRTPEELCPD